MMTTKVAWLSAAALCLLLSIGCATRRVTRIDSDESIDLSGRWNDSDSKLVADEMVRDINSHPWIDNFFTAEQSPPAVIVGRIRNSSSEHIDVKVFVKDIERSLINGGRVQMVADSSARDEIRAERDEQQFEASEETRSGLIQEVGADFILQGNISSIEDRVEGRKVVFYQVDLELVNLTTNLKVWIGTKEIRKFIEQSSVRI